MKNGHIKTNGSDKWYLDGKLHREDGPAIIRADGSQVWYLHGEIHRENRPAAIWTNGSEEWYLHGKRHREDGPAAAIGHKGTKLWYLYGEKFTEEKFLEITNASDEELPMYLGRGYDEYIQKRLKSGGTKNEEWTHKN